jgi:hypothetical protein
MRSIHLSVISSVILLLAGSSFAQGFLEKLKKGALDAAKETVNEAVNQTAPAVPPQNAGEPAPNNQAADAEKQQKTMAERMAELEKNKCPVSDTFKTPVKMYKELESGMSLEWCKAMLEKDGSEFYVHNNKIVLETDNGKVTLVFEKVISEKAPVLTACVVELPPSIRHAQALEKYKSEMPDATIRHEAVPRKLPTENDYLMDGISLDMQFSMTLLTDILTSAAKTVTVESKLLVGKAFLVYHRDNRKVVVCESSKDGTVTIPDGLNARQQEASIVVKDQMLAAVQKVTVLIEDNAMAEALQNLQKEQQDAEKKQQQQKNAEALAF